MSSPAPAAAPAPVPPTTGARYNNGKPRLSLILEASHALTYGARALEFGQIKYGRGNYRKGLKATECMDSMARHMSAYLAGEDTDPESGLPHAALLMSNAVLFCENHGAGTIVDDRSTSADEDVPFIPPCLNPLSEQPQPPAT